MAQASDIREHMEVRDAAGVPVGAVDHVEGDRIKLARSGSPDGQHHYVPLSAVARVDAHVHLNSTAAALGLAAVGGAAAAGAATGATGGGSEGPLPPVLNRAVDGAKPRGNFYLPWIVGLVGILLLFALFKSCVNHKEAGARDPVVTNATMAEMNAAASTSAATQYTALSGLGAYLGGAGPTPQTFTFERLNFDTARSDIRPADQDEVNQVATVLNHHKTARIRIAGYADARGSDAANAALGKARAEAVKTALVAKGVDAGRIETASGGESDPVDTNATAPGQAQNRRTELVVLQR